MQNVVPDAFSADSGRNEAASVLASDLLTLETRARDAEISPQALLIPLGITRLETVDSLSAPVVYSRLKSLATYRAGITPIMNLLEPTMERSYAIFSGVTVLATGTIIRGKNGQWYPGGLGPPALARVIQSLWRTENVDAKTKNRSEVIVLRTPPPIGAEFGGRWVDRSLWLTPTQLNEHFGWVPGRAVLADSVFSKLSPIARNILAGPHDQ
jgi:hypothetical protein